MNDDGRKADDGAATLSRREALAALLAAGAASPFACTPRSVSREHPRDGDQAMSEKRPRMPAIYLPHGGGPWPFVDLGGFAEPRETRALAAYLAALPANLPERPKAMVVVSAHWEAPVPTVMTSARPPMLYDYYGFPPEAYRVTWPAPGAPELAGRVRSLLEASGFQTAADGERGFDHGTFVPLKVAFPDADVPTVQLSLQQGLDPARHLAMGKALAPLRDEGVLLVGSGMSFHNLRDYRRAAPHSVVFDGWLQAAVAKEPAAREAELASWAAAPSARQAHPREEHLLPLMVIAGAAGADAARIAYSDTFGGAKVTSVHFGG